MMAEPNERLKTLVSTNDGFVVAQKDLEIRGAGEFFGTRQSGQPQMPALMLAGDTRLLARAREAFVELARDEAYAHERAQVFAAARKKIDRSGMYLARN